MNLNNQNNSTFKHKKAYGQNFISDPNLLNAIVKDAQINKNTNVLEIGTGMGSLTKILCENAKYVISYEIDKSLAPYIINNLENFTNFKLIMLDILKQKTADIEKLFNDEPYVIIANLPYYITSPIIFKFLEESENLVKMIIMVQKEVAERAIATAGTKNYGLFTVSLNSVSNVKILRNVKRHLFKPVPNVDSAILLIEFNKNKYEINNFNLFKHLIKSAFSMRRKTLLNNIKKGFNLSTGIIENLLTSCNIHITERGENLTCDQFVILANELNKIITIK